MPLTRLPEKKRARVVEITGGSHLRDKLMGMGVYAGRELLKLELYRPARSGCGKSRAEAWWQSVTAWPVR